VVARQATADLISTGGIWVRSRALQDDFIARPRAVSELIEPTDVLLVATKASGLGGILERVRTTPALVVPLLNGVEHMGRLRERFGAGPVVAGVIRIEADRPAPAEVDQTSPGARVDLAGEDDRIVALAAVLRQAGLEVRTGATESQVLWAKLARLNALALTTSASDRPLGFIRDDPRWRSALEGAVNETVAVAVAEGAQLTAEETLAELDSAHPELGSSMQRDIAAGREPELNAIAGAVLRAGARHGLRSPTVTWLAERVAQRARIPLSAAEDR
jgi:2-dehydropantoate 2-reductase